MQDAAALRERTVVIARLTHGWPLPNCGALAKLIEPDMRGLNSGHWAASK
jgi:hypothetical protein